MCGVAASARTAQPHISVSEHSVLINPTAVVVFRSTVPGPVHVSMLRSLPLLKRTITLDEALSEDNNILQELSYPEKRLDFFYYLFQHRPEIEAIVSFHLGVTKDACTTGEVNEWVHGSFNACIPVYINDSTKCLKKVYIRFPLPYKVGELQYPGNGEEKLRCEVATYIWMQSNCPDIPIPYLRGFGFPGGQTVRDSAPTLPLLFRTMC